MSGVYIAYNSHFEQIERLLRQAESWRRGGLHCMILWKKALNRLTEPTSIGTKTWRESLVDRQVHPLCRDQSPENQAAAGLSLLLCRPDAWLLTRS